jgi:hypothetical protein
MADIDLALPPSVRGPEQLIVVDIGPDRRTSTRERALHRCYDFYPLDDLYPDGLGGEYLRQRFQESHLRGAGAGRLLDFLIDDVRPALVSQSRMDPHKPGQCDPSQQSRLTRA